MFTSTTRRSGPRISRASSTSEIPCAPAFVPAAMTATGPTSPSSTTRRSSASTAGHCRLDSALIVIPGIFFASPGGDVHHRVADAVDRLTRDRHRLPDLDILEFLYRRFGGGGGRCVVDEPLRFPHRGLQGGVGGRGDDGGEEQHGERSRGERDDAPPARGDRSPPGSYAPGGRFETIAADRVLDVGETPGREREGHAQRHCPGDPPRY